jgi:hypothetical protein
MFKAIFNFQSSIAGGDGKKLQEISVPPIKRIQRQFFFLGTGSGGVLITSSKC